MPGIYAVDITSWTDFKKYAKQLKKPEVKEKFSTVVIDTVSIATDLCEKYILAQNSVEKLSDVAWGGGWSAYKKEFEGTFRELTQLGYGIIFIAHSKTKPTQFKDSEGNAIESVYPDINKTGFNVVNRLVDLIAYLSIEDVESNGSSKRYLYTRSTPYIFAGSRYKFLSPKISFGYKELVNAIADSIEKEIENGAQVTDNTDLTTSSMRPFEEAMKEAESLWIKLTANNNIENVKKIQSYIAAHFNSVIKLSSITENQQELLENVIEDMKKIEMEN